MGSKLSAAPSIKVAKWFVHTTWGDRIVGSSPAGLTLGDSMIQF